MARRTPSGAGYLARAVAIDIRKEIGGAGISRRELARQVGMSEPYLRDRLNFEFPFTIDDAETIYNHFGIEPGARFAKIEDELPDNVTTLRVGGRQDDGALENYAANTDDSQPQEDDHTP